MLIKSETYRYGLFTSSTFNIIARVLGFVQTLAIAYYFGANETTDIYFYLLATVTLFSGYITMLNSSALIPEAMRRYVQENKESGQVFLNYFFLWCIIFAMICAVCTLIFPINVFKLLSQFEESVLQKNRNLIIVAIPLIMLMTMSQFLSDVLVSQKYFTLPMLGNIGTNVFTIIVMVFVWDTVGIGAVLGAVVFSHIVQIVFYIWLLKKKIVWKFIFRKPYISTATRDNIVFGQLGNLFSLIGGYLPSYLFSGLAKGIISASSFGQRIADLPANFITSQFSLIAGIKFNNLIAMNENENIDQFFTISLEAITFVLAPISAMLYFNNEAIISLLYKRGAFTGEVVFIAATYLKLLSINICLVGIVAIGARLFIAAQLNKQVFGYQILSNVVLVLLSSYLVKTSSYQGYPIALSVVNIANILVNGIFIRRYFPYINYFTTLLKVAVVFALNFTIAWFLHLIIQQSKCNTIISLLVFITLQTIALLFFIKYGPINPVIKAVIKEMVKSTLVFRKS